MFSKPVWKWINLAVFICMVIVSVLAETIPLAGYTTGKISALYPSPLAPAPLTFAIWWVIYLYLAIFWIVHLFSKASPCVTEALGPWFIISCIANIAWIFTWHYRLMSLAMLSIAILLVSLIVIEYRLRDTRENAYQRWFIRAPFSIYYGWITVATIVNVSVWLSVLGFNGFGWPSQLWQVIVLFIGGAILCLGIWVNRDVLYGLAGLWGYAGIMIRQLSLDTVGGSYFWSLAAIVINGAAILFTIMIVAFACPVFDMPVLNRIGKDKMSSDPINGGKIHEK